MFDEYITFCDADDSYTQEQYALDCHAYMRDMFAYEARCSLCHERRQVAVDSE